MLGEIRETPSENGELKIVGNIRTYTLDCDFQLEPVERRVNNRSPTHNVVMRGRHGKGFHAGVCWQGHNNDYGRYFSLNIEVPEVFDGTMNLIAGENGSSGVFIIRRAVEKAATSKAA